MPESLSGSNAVSGHPQTPSQESENQHRVVAYRKRELTVSTRTRLGGIIELDIFKYSTKLR